MKTLIFNGSPRKNGDAMQLVSALTAQLEGECQLVHAYYCGVAPCTDCRRCLTQSGCSIDDAMTPLYAAIEAADNIVLASPLNFALPTGMLLAVLSRLQTYYCAEMRGETPLPKAKRGGIILVGGGDGPTLRAEKTMRLLLTHMNAREVGPFVCSHATDRLPPERDEAALRAVGELADFLNAER